MIDLLGRYLQRLLDGSGADVAVVCSRSGPGPTGSVIAARPAGVVGVGGTWPMPDAIGAAVIDRGPAAVDAAVPVSVRPRLPGIPSAALWLPLGDPDLVLLLIWSDGPAADELSKDLRLFVAEEITYAASGLAVQRASADSMFDSQVLLEAVRDRSGQVVDFRYRSANRAACAYLGLPESDLVGRTQLEGSPNLEGSELHRRYIRCLEDGQPVLLEDFPLFNGILDDARRYDIRVTRAGADLLSITWRDITERLVAAQRIADSEQEAEEARRQEARADSRFRRSMESAAVGMCIVAPDGAFIEVNEALCLLFGYDAMTLVQKTWQELTAPEYLQADLKNVEDILGGRSDSYRMLKQFVRADGNAIWGDLSVSCVRADNGEVETFVSQIVDVTATIEATERYRLLAENSGDMVAHIRNDRFVWVSPSARDLLGAPAEYWIGREVREIVPADALSDFADDRATLFAGGVIRRRVRVRSVDGVIHWTHLHAKAFYDASGRHDGFTAALRLIDDEVEAQQQAEEARKLQAIADARYRRSMDTAAIGMCLLAPDGAFLEVNPALCDLLGYDAETLISKTWQEVTAPGYLEVGEDERQEVFAGVRDSYRIVKQYLHADGHPIWVDVSVNCVRDENGEVEALASQIADISAEVEAREQLARSDERNRALAQRLQEQSGRLAAELRSAADYLASIMPRGLAGTVQVASWYLPSRELGGDCFDYTWLDDDHLLVYLLDVSGHGIEPALLAVSVHNMLRSGSLGIGTLVAPDLTLAELNRLFRMDEQGGHYFTIWYGVYQASTRTLRYASAGAPPALAFPPAAGGPVVLTELSTMATPVGMFEDTVFTSSSYSVQPGSRILICSDGAHELGLDGGRALSFTDFKDLNARLAESSGWSLAALVKELKALTPNGAFDDDCSLIQLTF